MATTLQFSHPVGSFRESVRAYREYKKVWRFKMEKKLYTPEEAYEMTMKDIKAIYDKEEAV